MSRRFVEGSLTGWWPGQFLSLEDKDYPREYDDDVSLPQAPRASFSIGDHLEEGPFWNRSYTTPDDVLRALNAAVSFAAGGCCRICGSDMPQAHHLRKTCSSQCHGALYRYRTKAVELGWNVRMWNL